MPNDIRNERATETLRAFEPFPAYQGEFSWPNPGPWLVEKIRALMPARRGERKDAPAE